MNLFQCDRGFVIEGNLVVRANQCRAEQYSVTGGVGGLQEIYQGPGDVGEGAERQAHEKS